MVALWGFHPMNDWSRGWRAGLLAPAPSGYPTWGDGGTFGDVTRDLTGVACGREDICTAGGARSSNLGSVTTTDVTVALLEGCGDLSTSFGVFLFLSIFAFLNLSLVIRLISAMLNLSIMFNSSPELKEELEQVD